MEDQEMIQTFSPHTSQKTFADSICPARVWYGVRSTLMPLVVATRAKFDPNFLSLSRSRYLALTHTESPLAAVRATQELVGGRVIFIWITFRDFRFDEEESKKRAKEEIGHL